MFRPWLSKYQNLSTNDDHFQNGQNQTDEDNLDDFTLYLSDVSTTRVSKKPQYAKPV